MLGKLKQFRVLAKCLPCKQGKLSWKGSEMGVLVGCHRNVSMIGTRPQSRESKPAAFMALSAREWKPTVGGGAQVSPGRKEQKPKG